MRTEERFEGGADRYRFGTGMCRTAEGFVQVTSGQDAWYFGMWVDVRGRRIVTFAEGDLTIETADDDAELAAALRRHADWHARNGFRFRIDAETNRNAEERLRGLGAGDLIDGSVPCTNEGER